VLLVFGPRSTDYDFGPDHVLTPRRFGPGIDLLRAVGAEPGLAPDPAPDADLRLCHVQEYIEVVRRFSVDPFGPMEAGIGWGDNPPFADMHEASAAVAGGSMRAMEAILDGRVEHAFHPGGGLHHAMRARASGFCIYNDPALAIARARRDGLRVMYIDLDVHHGDGVQALFWEDPGVLTFSIHESGRYLFPGTGDVDEVGEGASAGTVVNVSHVAANTAQTSEGKDILPDLAAADDRYYPMPDMTDQAELTFPAPPRKAGAERTVFLHSRGWYQLHLRNQGPPDLTTFNKILTIPGAAVQFAADRFTEWQRGDIR